CPARWISGSAVLRAWATRCTSTRVVSVAGACTANRLPCAESAIPCAAGLACPRQRRSLKLERSVAMKHRLKTTTALALLGLGLAAAPVLADDDCDAPVERWQPRDAVREMAVREGWQIQRLKIDDGC